MAAPARSLESRLSSLRGRLAANRAAEDLQAGLLAGAGLVLLLGVLRWLNLSPVGPGAAAGAGAGLAAGAWARAATGIERARASSDIFMWFSRGWRIEAPP